MLTVPMQNAEEQTKGNRLSFNNFMIVYFHKFLEHGLKIPKGQQQMFYFEIIEKVMP